MLKHAFTALHKRVLSPRFFVRSPDGLIYQSSIDRTPVAFSSTIFPLYIALPPCSRHHRQHVVTVISDDFASRCCHSVTRRDRCASDVSICQMLRRRRSHRVHHRERCVQHGSLSPVSLFLVYNDALFFLAFNILSLQNFKRGVR